MNVNRNIRIDFRVNGKHDHFIQKKKGKHISEMKATKKKRR